MACTFGIMCDLQQFYTVTGKNLLPALRRRFRQNRCGDSTSVTNTAVRLSQIRSRGQEPLGMFGI